MLSGIEIFRFLFLTTWKRTKLNSIEFMRTEMTSHLSNYHREYSPYGSYSLFQFERSDVISVLKHSIEYSFVFFKCLLDDLDIFSIGESTMWNFQHSVATNWSIMAAGAQMEQVKLGEFDLKGMKLVHNLCTDTVIHKAAYSSCKTMFFSRL